MNLSSRDWWILLGVGALAFYLMRKKLESALDESIAAPIANTIIGLTLPGDIKVLGTVHLPNGQMIPVNNVTVDSNLNFIYRGARYHLTGRIGNVYEAVNV